jgi:hypothetical protein
MSSDFSPTCGAACPRLGKRRVNFSKPWKNSGEIFQCLEIHASTFPILGNRGQKKRRQKNEEAGAPASIFLPAAGSHFSVFCFSVHPPPASSPPCGGATNGAGSDCIVRSAPVRAFSVHHSNTPSLQYSNLLFRFAVGPRRKSRYLPAAINHQPLTINHAF